jgi:hypothetical protein
MPRQQRRTKKKKQQYEWADSAILFSPYSAVIREIAHPTNLAILRSLFKPRWIYENDKRGKKVKVKKANTKVKKAKTSKEVKKAKKAKAKKGGA